MADCEGEAWLEEVGHWGMAKDLACLSYFCSPLLPGSLTSIMNPSCGNHKHNNPFSSAAVWHSVIATRKLTRVSLYTLSRNAIQRLVVLPTEFHSTVKIFF